MEFNNFVYILLLALILIVPLVFTASKKTGFHLQLRYALPALFISAFIFLLWDIKFTATGVWSYKEKFTLGIFHKGLPLEEWLFYFIIPFAALFVYDFIKQKRPTLNHNNFLTVLSLVFIIGFGLIAYFYRIRFYTFFCFLFTTIYLGYVIFRKQFKSHLTHFYISYLIMLIPYLILSGVLTWITAIEYHQEQVLNIWILMIPIENLVYLLLLMLINTTVYEYLAEKKYF